MSQARTRFVEQVRGLQQAADVFSTGAAGEAIPEEAARVLRRGAAVNGLIALEHFVQERTAECLGRLSDWPSAFSELPEKLRIRATLGAIRSIEKYAQVLKREGEDFESEIVSEASLVSSSSRGIVGFSKHFYGDRTGNLSAEGLKELLSSLQVVDFWSSGRLLSVRIGYATPNLKQDVENIVRSRHRSAHVASHYPTQTEIVNLPSKLAVVGLAVDAAMTSSVEFALRRRSAWLSGDYTWLDQIKIFSVEPSGARYRVVKYGAARALRVVDNYSDAYALLPNDASGNPRLCVVKATDGRPVEWRLL